MEGAHRSPCALALAAAAILVLATPRSLLAGSESTSLRISATVVRSCSVALEMAALVLQCTGGAANNVSVSLDVTTPIASQPSANSKTRITYSWAPPGAAATAFGPGLPVAVINF